jgi:hypothetical protein
MTQAEELEKVNIELENCRLLQVKQGMLLQYYQRRTI